MINRRSTVANIQALRAVAALLVVCRHIGDPKIGIEAQFLPHERPLLDTLLGAFAGVGVDIFFVISGFIMVVTSWKTCGVPGASLHFFARRLIRIFPPYWAALVPIIAGIFFTGGHLLRARAGATNLLADFILIPQAHPTLGISWTLSYEMFFYIVFAVLLFLPQRLLGPALLVWAAVTFGFDAAFHDSSDIGLAFLGSVIPLQFIVGSGIGLLYVHGRMPYAWSSFAVAIVANVVLWYVFKKTDETLGIENDILRRLALLGPSCLLVYSLVSLELTKNRVAPGWLVKLGDSSYALYLWHITVLYALGRLLTKVHPHGLFLHALFVAAMIAAAVGFSMLVYEYFEKPVTGALNRALSKVIGRSPSIKQPVSA